MKTIILDDGIEYVIIKELLIDNIKYTLFSNIQDPKDICLRKTIIEILIGIKKEKFEICIFVFVIEAFKFVQCKKLIIMVI